MDKQIEEMAKVIEEAMAKARRTLGGHNNIAMFYATMLSKAGYHRIPENAVVLTREEFEKFKKQDLFMKDYTIVEVLENETKNARKETAEKFAERVKMAFYYEFDEFIPSIMADKIDEICKEITGGEKEISNETV